VFGFVTDGKWNKNDLTYKFREITSDLPTSTVYDIFQQAFQVNQ